MRLTCGVLGHSAQAYYAWTAAPISQRDLEDAYLTNALIDALIDPHGDDLSSAAGSSQTKSPAAA